MTLKNLAVSFMITLLSSCVIAVNTIDWAEERWLSKINENAELVERLALGTMETNVRVKWGEPDFSEAFVRRQNEYAVLYHRIRYNEHDGKATKDETTPLAFVDGELVVWGDSAVEHTLVI